MRLPVKHVLLSSSQCLCNTHLRYKMLIALGQPLLLFVYVILPEYCYYVCTVVQHSYLIYIILLVRAMCEVSTLVKSS